MDMPETKKEAAPEVIVYSTPSCPYCSRAKEYLTRRGVQFTDYDVSKDQARAKEMFMKTNQGAVPVLQINGRIVIGFDRQLIDDALARKAPPKRENAIQNIIFDPFSA